MFNKLLVFVEVFQIHLLTIFVIVESMNITDNVHNLQREAKEFFHKANAVIHDALNEVFHLLDLPSDAIENGTLHKLLNTYAELKKINTLGHKIYDDIELMTRVNKTIDNSTINFVIDINELTMETLLNHLVKRVPKHIKLQEAMKSKTEDTSSNDTLADGENLDFSKYHAAVNVSQYQETNLTFTLDHLPDNDEVWVPESKIKTKVRELLSRSRRINNGDPRDISQYPFVASVHVERRCTCGGSIISRQMIITAASCVHLAYGTERTQLVEVRVGSSFCNKGGEVVPVQTPFFYPLFDPENLQHNLALLKLQRQLDLGTKTVKRIDINFDNGEPTGDLTMAGFGDSILHTDRDDKTVARSLKVTKLHFCRLENCMKFYTSNFVSEKNFCAGLRIKPAGGCRGDTGDPGVLAGQLLGVASLVPPACGQRAPTVFTRVRDYRDWICRITDDLRIYKAAVMAIRSEEKHKTPSEAQLLSALLLRKLLSEDNRKTKTTKKITFHDILYGDFRDWYDDQMKELESSHETEQDPYETFLANMSILPMDYVLMNSQQRDEAIQKNSGRPLDNYYSSSTTTEPTTEEYYTSIIYLDEENATEATTISTVDARFTRYMNAKMVNKEVNDDTRRDYDGGSEENRSSGLEIAEINAKIRAERD